jgi:hypothetical protein
VSASVSTVTDQRSQAPRAGLVSRPRLRHGFFAAALLVVAALRLADDQLLWAALLGAAGLVEAGLAFAARTQRGTAGEWGAAVDPDVPLPQPSVVQRSLVGHRRNQRLWLFGTGLCTLASVLLLFSTPAVAAVLAVLALVSLHRVRRERRSIAALHRLASSDTLNDEATA